MKTKIREWHMAEYPTDELGAEIDSEVTFEDIFIALDTNKNVYEVLGVGDSIIRENVFSKLADLMEVDYDYIYYQWLYGNRW